MPAVSRGNLALGMKAIAVATAAVNLPQAGLVRADVAHRPEQILASTANGRKEHGKARAQARSQKHPPQAVAHRVRQNIERLLAVEVPGL